MAVTCCDICLSQDAFKQQAKAQGGVEPQPPDITGNAQIWESWMYFKKMHGSAYVYMRMCMRIYIYIYVCVCLGSHGKFGGFTV